MPFGSKPQNDPYPNREMH